MAKPVEAKNTASRQLEEVGFVEEERLHTVILGAGVSGLSAAYALQEFSPRSYSIYEQAPSVGGLCRTQQVDGYQFDAVSHVLHFRSEETKRLVQQILGEQLVRQERSAWIYFQQRYVPYPFQTHLNALPSAAKMDCLNGYLKAWVRRKLTAAREPENFGEWVEQYFGGGIARHFMRPYNQKLWGVTPQELSLDWIRPFVPQTQLRQVISNVISRRNHHEVGYNPWFFYPARGGIQTLCEAFRARLTRVHLNQEAIEIDLENRTVQFRDGDRVGYEQLISTIPLPSLIQRIKTIPERLQGEVAGLRWTSLLNLTYCLRRPLPRPFHWAYFPEAEFPFFRLVFPSNISAELAPEGAGLIAAEISNPEPGKEDELEQTVQAYLIKLGWIEQAQDVVRIVRNYFPYAYPVHDLERGERVRRLLHFLQTKRVWSIGRFGAWHYSSMEDAITEALHIAPAIHASTS
jgi:protoporphyrinogen oxidase